MNIITVIIESPKGTSTKYDYLPETKQFKLSKMLPAGLTWPFDFGFIPDTIGDDGDPLDIIIVSETTGFPGCLVDCRIIGAFKVVQTERNGTAVRNDRFVGVPVVTHLYADVNELAQLPEAILNQLEAFFKNYNEQAGKKFEVLERLYAADAAALIR